LDHQQKPPSPAGQFDFDPMVYSTLDDHEQPAVVPRMFDEPDPFYNLIF
jgi:hypothetical protein